MGVAAAPRVQRESQQGVFHQDGHGSQDEGGKQVHVDAVPHTVKLSGVDVTVYDSLKLLSAFNNFFHLSLHF